MREDQTHNVTYLKGRRKALRGALTSAEAKLWSLLKGGALEGRKFRRQHSIEHYIADFYCPTEKIIIELDGQVHFDTEQQLLDADRDRRLHDLGFKVLRFENRLVFEDAEGVLAEIARNFGPARVNHP